MTVVLRLRTPTFLLALLVTPVALAGPPPKHNHHARRQHFTTAKLDVAPQRGAPAGRSVGSPTEGRLVGGVRLAEAPHLRIVPTYAAGDVRWGLEPLVSMIDRAARAVRKEFPDSVASVGHLSRAGGGEIDRHASHESGRDADIGFYVRNHLNKPIYADHFVAFRADGTAASWAGAQLDVARNWAFVAAIASDPRAHVTHIFVATPIRVRLLEYAQRTGASHTVRVRASELMAQPRGALPHDDHFHVRIGCPPGMEQCIEQPVAHRGVHGTLARAPGRHASKSHASPSPEKAPPRPPERQPESSRSEPGIPSLAPVVPGLDSVIIPAPLARPVEPPRPGARARVPCVLRCATGCSMHCSIPDGQPIRTWK